MEPNADIAEKDHWWMGTSIVPMFERPQKSARSAGDAGSGID